MLTRPQIIFSFLNCRDAEEDRISDRLQQCNVRVVRTDGTTEMNTVIRTARQAGIAMQDDPTIARVEYNFNGAWTTAC